jgi:hypothetical protein
MVTNTTRSTEARICALAAEHGMVAERLSIDVCADKVSELSCDDVMHNRVEDLVVTLRRKGVITDRQAKQLYGDDLNQQP